MTVLARKLAVLALLLAACAPTPTNGDRAAGDPDEAVRAIVDRTFEPLLERYGVAGMAVAVTVDGRSSVVTYGVAARGSGDAVTADTLFEIGSVSKTFTATLATYAEARGVLSLADHPSQHLPALRGAPVDAATLENLGTYTAGGLPLQFPDDVTDATVVEYFRDWVPAAPPGTVRLYSNPSIGLLGQLSAAALKADFGDLVENQLLPGLGLDDSFITVPADRMPRYAQGYDRDDRPVRVNPGVLDAQAYGIKSTAADMIRFIESNIDPNPLAPPMREAVAGTHLGRVSAGGLVQGLGWEQYPYPTSLEQLLTGNSATTASQPTPAAAVNAPTRATLFNKTGSTNGFGAYAAFVPQRRIGIVMLANRNIPIPARVTAAHAVLEELAAR